jgi:hypothetical protein
VKLTRNTGGSARPAERSIFESRARKRGKCASRASTTSEKAWRQISDCLLFQQKISRHNLRKMPRETDPSNNAKSFLLQALRENVRIDGRGFDEYRPIDLSFGDEYGVATVQLGKTRVMVRVSSEVVKASADRKFDGVFTISTELSPIASPAFEVGR